ncbi:arabinogalactan oligomer/maltooligosaccharide transport system substrate-binding protein [Alkalibacillus filiformis]|uniref:Arabinogalactan oligomer/maltooligosaccharide transport system substrate-binding protein n=1 Tax=Alkalibacillus filiformis TaxID=200990 RepID=A0ABU0DUQ2_9BACI|nr:extracellular solute-binding protein [Alkalibacillus filiformis]MDQ0352173.1 arabinogalactan oligomer/maltooligosaccharide transport system substrate-binding protein [Alkalibacillus filiformis]
MAKRLFLFLVLVFAASVVLVACGPDRDSGGDSDGGADGDSPEQEKPEELLVWADEDKAEGIEGAIAAFEEEYGIEVVVEELEMATRQREQLNLDGPAGTGPDVLTLPHDQIGGVASQGLIAPLEVEQDVIDIYTESSIDAVTFEGEVYGLPKATETPVLFYNKEHLDEAPDTFDELFEFSQDFTDGDNYGYLALWDNYYFAHGILASYGGFVFEDQDGTLDPSTIGLNNDGAVEAAEYIQMWYEEGLFPDGIIGEAGGSTKTGLFEEGRVAASMDGPWAVQGLNNAGVDFGVSPMPELPNGEYAQTFVGVKSWNVSNYSEYKDWSTELVTWLANEENSLERFQLVNEIPPIASLIDDPAIAEDPVAEAVAIQSQRGIPMPNIPQMDEVWGPMADALQLIAIGDQEPEEALDEAVEVIRTNIETNFGE